MDLPNYGMTQEEEDEERLALTELLEVINSSSAEHLDKLLGEYMKSDSLLLTTAALRFTWQEHKVLKNWHPLLEHALKKWPTERAVFVGLTNL